MAKLLKERV
jgi:hypothetical protein